MFAGEALQATEVLSKPVVDKLVREYQACLRENAKMAVATAAIKTLTSLIVMSEATTMMGLEKEIKEAAAALQRCAAPVPCLQTAPRQGPAHSLVLILPQPWQGRVAGRTQRRSR